MENPFHELDKKLDAVLRIQEDILTRLREIDPHREAKWFNIKQLSEYLPGKTSKQTIYNWVCQRKIPYHKSYKRLRFLKSDIDEWLNLGRQKTTGEIESERVERAAKKDIGKFEQSTLSVFGSSFRNALFNKH